MFHKVVQRGFLRSGKHYYIYFVISVSSSEKKIQNRLPIGEVIAKVWHPVF